MKAVEKQCLSEAMLVWHCAPTLAGLKTANLFSCVCEAKEKLLRTIQQLNRRLYPKGIRILPLKHDGRRVLIYVFRLQCLENDLAQQQTKDILNGLGYKKLSAKCCLLELIIRLKNITAFPHEIGLFLGYPPEDVEGFIKYKGYACKYVGCWKVYGDELYAKKQFELYKRCRKEYSVAWRRGTSVEQLIVAV